MFDSKPFTERFAAALERLESEFAKVRTGRAHPDMLSGISVEVYGTSMPLAQVASVSAPEPQQLLVTPFDPANVQAIAAAIRADQTLDFNPSDDGRNVRVPIPPLTEERRREIAKSLGNKTEDARIQLRNIREEARKAIKLLTAVSDDEKKRLEKGIDDEVAKFNSRIDEAMKAKETEVMTI
ncbi:MAG: ribosome-recycling factor [Candidatus Nomurabacteria bacterium]|jgi:ribosome recycling factor|nr:ribosome-recycling factor [Candidatus Nomurabacteria bacterium]